MNAAALQELPARRSWPAISAFPELAPFERHVALLLIDDVSRGTIARRLGVTRETVSTAVYRLVEKLEVGGSAGLARLAIRRGYIQP